MVLVTDLPQPEDAITVANPGIRLETAPSVGHQFVTTAVKTDT